MLTLWHRATEWILESASPGPREVLPARLLVGMGFAMSLGGVLWTALALAFGAHQAALVPASYVVGTVANFAWLRRRGSLALARSVQAALSLLLPFVFQLALGGFEASGAVVIWSLFAMLSALTASTWAGRLTAGGMLTLLLGASVLLDSWAAARAGVEPDPQLGVVLLTMNLTIVAWLVGGLTVYLDRSRVERHAAVAEAHEELVALAERLRMAEQLAREASEAKSQFLTRMSHELRTPLNAILGYAELLEESVDDAELEVDAQRIQSAGRHLLSLVNDVLDLARVEAGAYEPRTSVVCVRALVQRVEAMMRPLAERQHNRLRLELEGPTVVVTDGRMLEQILVNLLSNACKFTERGEVFAALTVDADREEVELRVHDTGVGMDAIQCERALRPFQQADHELTQRHDGTGLGLPLVTEFARLLGGSFAIDSAPGRGTDIVVRLPVTLLASGSSEGTTRAVPLSKAS